MSTDGDLSFVTFLYEDIQWSDGNAYAGFFHGYYGLIEFIPGSNSDARNLPTTSNVGVPGMWMYRVDSQDIIMPPGLP